MLCFFEDFELREEDFRLHRAGQRISLEPKSLRVLLLLVSRAGHLVDKQSLLDTVWAGAFVEENNVARTVASLRRELGDDSRKPRLIETVPTRGYRFIAPVQTREDATSPALPAAEYILKDPPGPEVASSPKVASGGETATGRNLFPAVRRTIALVSVVLVVLLSVTAWFWWRSRTRLRSVPGLSRR